MRKKFEWNNYALWSIDTKMTENILGQTIDIQIMILISVNNIIVVSNQLLLINIFDCYYIYYYF